MNAYGQPLQVHLMTLSEYTVNVLLRSKLLSDNALAAAGHFNVMDYSSRRAFAFYYLTGMDIYTPLFFIHYLLYSFLHKLCGQNISINQQLYYDMIQYQFIPPESVN